MKAQSQDISNMVQMTPKAAPTGTHAHILRVNRFSFAAPECKFKSGKARNAFDAERAITDTIKYLGVMSLKNSDHAGDKKDVTQATAQRTAADRLLAADTVVLLGTWSNGIAVGPGAGFVACTNEPEVIAPVKAAKSAPRTRKPAKSAMQIVAEESKPWVSGNVPPAPAMHGPAFVAKPRVRVPLATMQPAAVVPAGDPPGLTIPSVYTTAQLIAAWHFYLDNGMSAAKVYHAALRNNHFVQAPTIVPTPIYTPAVGDTVAITYQHERMTTDRVVNVQRVAADGKTFRGYDRTYDRVRNYDMARVLTIRRIGGEGVDIAAG